MEGLKKPAKSEPPRRVFFKSYEGKEQSKILGT